MLAKSSSGSCPTAMQSPAALVPSSLHLHLPSEAGLPPCFPPRPHRVWELLLGRGCEASGGLPAGLGCRSAPCTRRWEARRSVPVAVSCC